MGKAFPDPDLAYHPGEGVAFPVGAKIIPTVPASQSERPQLRPVSLPVLPAE